MRTVIFDLDGTLADTSGDLIAAANHCFIAMGAGAQLDPQRDAATALRGGRAMLTLGLDRMGTRSEAEIDRWYPELLRAYGDAIDHHTVVYPGAIAAVEALRSAGYGVGICTNKPEGLAEQLLQSLGIRSLFGSMIGADTLPVRKPDPGPLLECLRRLDTDRCLYVGDSEVDAETAQAARLPFFLYTHGYRKTGVTEIAPAAAFDHFSALPGLVAKAG